MRVVLVAENWPPRVGGIENYLTHAVGLLPKGSVTAVVPQTASEATDSLPGQGVGNVVRKRFFWPPLKPAWLPLFIFLYRLARREKIDVVLCGKALCEGQLGYYLKKYCGVSYVLFTYGMEIETWRKSPRTVRALRRVIGGADRIVYINDVTKAVLNELGARREQLIKIWPGIDEVFLSQSMPDDIQTVQAKYGLPGPYIISVGRLIPRKGFDVLIEAFSQLDQTKFDQLSLVIVGDGPLHEDLMKLAQRNFIAKSVTFLTAVPTDDLVKLMAGAQIFALTPQPVPGDLEGFGIVYIEAAAQGVPAVGTKTGGVPEAIAHKQTGLVVQTGSAAAVREAIVYLLTHASERDRMGQAARQRARQQFDWRRRIMLVKGMIDTVVTMQLVH